jgi:gamma-glutamyltranspeptidase/glutathione hydrolase
MPRDFQLPGRSAVHATRAMAATSHPLASLTALDMLRAGGNAVDAAIAAAAVLAVVEPQMTGIGGDCFALIARPDGTLIGLNGSGRAPAAAEAGWFVERGIRAIAGDSPHAVTVPGAVDAWERLMQDHGRLGLAQVLQPAIRYAREGVAVAPRVAWDWMRNLPKLQNDEGARMHLLVDGRPPREGEVMRFPALARTLARIAEEGRAAFYEGEVAEEIAATVQAKGGLLTAEDIAAHQAAYVTPLTTAYRGVEVVELPPANQGLTALAMLNILERFDLAALDPLGPERFHLEMEAARLAYAVRDAHLADPEHMREQPEALAGKAYAARLAAGIDPSRAAGRVEIPELAHTDTVYLTVVDEDRLAVSFINSLYSGFGTGIVTPETGVTLQNRGSCFVADPAHPNCIGPGKRPLHTLIPGMACENGRPTLAFGVMGGAYQACGHAHVLGNLIDFGMDVQAAIDAPRAFYEGGRLGLERGVPEATAAGLRQRGHDVFRVEAPFGGGQAIRIDWERGTLVGGSDPRKDGCALGF